MRRLLKPLDRFGLKRYRIGGLIWAKDRIGREVRNYRVLHEAQSLQVGDPEDAFVRSLRFRSSGIFELGEIFVCEVSPAFYIPYLGTVANEEFEVFGDSILNPVRFESSPVRGGFRPRQFTKREGPISSVQRIDSYSFWHWMADCLPQVLTLEAYMEGRPLTLLAGDDLGKFQREFLVRVIPENFHLEFVPAKKWIKTDRFILPSYLSGICHGFLPPGYYDEIRRRIVKGFALSEDAKPEMRVYLSRAKVARRRVGNEPALIRLLSEYGFKVVIPENLSIRDQVEMFLRTEVLASPHGSGLGAMVLSPHAKVLVLYPERNPAEFFYSMARSAGLEHYGLTHDYVGEADKVNEFTVDLERLDGLLGGPMGLKKRGEAS